MAAFDAPYKLGTFSAAGCAPFPGVILASGKVIALSAIGRIARQPLVGTSDLLEFIQHWEWNNPILSAAVEGIEQAAGSPNFADVSSLQIHVPFVPGSLVCAVANYRKHVVDFYEDPAERAIWEERMDAKARSNLSFVFSKPVSAVVGPQADVAIPDDVKMLDWEVELVVVIGKEARRVNRADALGYVAGYTVGNDLSARDFLARDDLQPGMLDFCGSKGNPGFNPIGPFIVPAQFVPDPQKLSLRLRLNGEIMQDEGSELMIDSVAKLIEYSSSRMVLRPGDMIMTGSPSGNAKSHDNRYLRVGDIVEAEVDGIGTQRIRFVAEK
ncbi:MULTISPECIES: fumarylacetoacetate hydrolase family protein [Sphingomonadaceae]|uniref:fumarylacetoacetate hydrolase family protein n=1 Tax=Sphingomonadales TaxID=204457 RepID=UPI0005E73A25|nr:MULTISPECIES: fumarylacetoacetate hydrolase family protein [Sphingomonadaceae]CDO38945.1 2-keto-4-pentenoate hydratase/2-oxohepta-3-ene-1,7-dioic acid hydratase [Novosphingobium sp. KN65.2]